MLHTPEQPTGDALALTHGAGSNASAPLLVSLSRAFCEAGLLVLRYDLPFRVARGSPTSPAAQARDREGVAGSAGRYASWRRGACLPAGIPTAAGRPR